MSQAHASKQKEREKKCLDPKTFQEKTKEFLIEIINLAQQHSWDSQAIKNIIDNGVKELSSIASETTRASGDDRSIMSLGIEEGEMIRIGNGIEIYAEPDTFVKKQVDTRRKNAKHRSVNETKCGECKKRYNKNDNLYPFPSIVRLKIKAEKGVPIQRFNEVLKHDNAERQRAFECTQK